MATFRADLFSKMDTKRRNILLVFGGVLLTLCLGALWAVLTFWHALFSNMPDIPDKSELWSIAREPSIEFLASDGTLLAQRGPRYGRAVDPSDLPAYVPHAFLAGEDKRFYDHNGVDNTAIARAAAANWRAGSTVQGGSTLTQQLVKNLFLTSDRTMRRKAQEVRLAYDIEELLTKDEILYLYLNRVYLGNRAFGIDAASQAYFGKRAKDLTLAEAALLAALPKAPSRLDPSKNLDGAKARQRYVLRQMLESDFITREEAERAQVEPITIVEDPVMDPIYGYVIDVAAEQLQTLMPDPPADMVVTLTIDRDVQTAAHETVNAVITGDGAGVNATSAAAVVIELTGRVTAMVGGLNYADSQFNRVTQAMRQPGSAFKTFVYAAGLEAGLDPYTVRVDRPTTIEGWSPRNYSGRFLGRMTLAEALARSVNTISAQIADEVGQEQVVAMAKRLGIRTDMLPVPSIALGSDETTLFDMTRAYGAFAKSGQRLDPFLIDRVQDTRGDVVFERQDTQSTIVLEAELAHHMNAMLARVVRSGTGTRAQVEGWDVAGKTGTSQEWRDAWFIGYTGTHVGGVWVGNDNDTPMTRVTGGSLPSDIFSKVMTVALAGDLPRALPGAENGFAPSPEAERRLTFYRDLAGAFGALAKPQIAAVDASVNQQ